MKVKAKALCFMAIAMLPLSGMASEQTGTVVDIRVSSPGALNPTHVLLSGTRTKNGCATLDWWQLNTDTAVGKNLLATLLMAKASGKSVTLWGNGSCTLRTDMEDVLQVGVPN